MAEQDFARVLTTVAFNLSTENSLRGVFHHQLVGTPVPSGRKIREIVDLCRAILFPSYFGTSKVTLPTVRYHIGVNLETLFDTLCSQITAALCFAQSADEIDPRKQEADSPCYTCHGTDDCVFDQLKSDAAAREMEALLAREVKRAALKDLSSNGFTSGGLPHAGMAIPFSSNLKDDDGQIAENISVEALALESQLKPSVSELEQKAKQIAIDFINALPKLRVKLAKDAKSAFFADPAASSLGEVICCYPGIRAIINYRIAHKLLKLGVPVIPRAITEMAHSETGIDINPGAQIGDCFSIDHGTGVVIGETCIIGNNVKLFQGVTLGAKTIPVDEKGMPLKIARHPILEDDVVVYSNATILGRITIGRGAIIGGNVWITEDVKPGMKVVQQRARH